MSANPTAGAAPFNPSIAASGGRRPRPKTLKRKLQNREAQRNTVLPPKNPASVTVL
jgi:hypothetical protein